jgi:hypothetical protein
VARCDVCGNEYAKSFEIHIENSMHTFDSLECAIQRVAPTCGNCGCRVIGHGVEVGGAFYCGAHCARAIEPTVATPMADHA